MQTLKNIIFLLLYISLCISVERCVCNDTADPRSTIGRKTNDNTTPLLIYHLMFS